MPLLHRSSCQYSWHACLGDHGHVVHCDNQAIVCVVNSGHSKDMMHCLFFIQPYWGFQLRAEHIPGENNVAADAISCGNPSLFFPVSPRASPIPQSLHELLVVQQPDSTLPSWVALLRNCLQQGWQAQLSRLTYQARSSMLSSVGRPTFPTTESTHSSAIYNGGLAAGTVKSYLVVMWHAHIALGLGDPRVANMLKLECVTKGLWRKTVGISN